MDNKILRPEQIKDDASRPLTGARLWSAWCKPEGEVDVIRRLQSIQQAVLSALSVTDEKLMLDDEEICKALDITDEEYLGEATAAFGGKDEGVVVDFMPLLKAQIAKLAPIIAARDAHIERLKMKLNKERLAKEGWIEAVEHERKQGADALRAAAETFSIFVEQAYNKGLAEQGSPRADLENKLADKEFAKKYQVELCKLKAVETAKVEERKVAQEIFTAYDEYVRLLGDELDEVVGMAASHGWKSHRFEAGEKCREAIRAIKVKFAIKGKQPNVEAEKDITVKMPPKKIYPVKIIIEQPGGK